MQEATRRVTHGIIAVRGEEPMGAMLATADEVRPDSCGHGR